jgi:hypothetical protein
MSLILFYKENQKKLTSNSIRRTVAWNDVASQMEKAGLQYTGDQCENKFASLKKQYLKKIDNMSAKSTGQKRFDFTYFDEFDEIFGKTPSVKPVSIASSSRIDNDVLDEISNFTEDLNTDDTDSEISNKRKGRKRNIDFVIDTMKETNAESENKKDSRHDAVMSLLKEGQDDFRNLMTRLIDKL